MACMHCLTDRICLHMQIGHHPAQMLHRQSLQVHPRSQIGPHLMRHLLSLTLQAHPL